MTRRRPRSRHARNAASTSSQPSPSSVQSPVTTTASTSLLGRRRAPRAGSGGSCCGASSRASARARPRSGGAVASVFARRASRRHALAAARSTGSSRPAALARRRHRVRVALRVDEDDLGLASCAAREGRASAASSQHVSKLLLAGVGDAGAPLDELRAIVQRVAERRDVQVGDVRDAERRHLRLGAGARPAPIRPRAGRGTTHIPRRS